LISEKMLINIDTIYCTYWCW